MFIFQSAEGRLAESRETCLVALEGVMPGMWAEAQTMPGGDPEGDLARWYAHERGWEYQGREAAGEVWHHWATLEQERAHIARVSPHTFRLLLEAEAAPTIRTYVETDYYAPVGPSLRDVQEARRIEATAVAVASAAYRVRQNRLRYLTSLNAQIVEEEAAPPSRARTTAVRRLRKRVEDVERKL